MNILRMAVMTLPLVWSVPGRAASGTICSQPNLLDLAARHYGAALAHATLLRASAAEVSTFGNRVVCTLDIRVQSYDATGQPAPQTVTLQRSFIAYRLEAGLRVDFGED